MFLAHLLLVSQKGFVWKLQHCNLFFLQLEENILCNLFEKHYFQTIKQKYAYSLKLRSTWKSKYQFCASINTFDWYLYHLILLLKPDCCNSFTLS